MLIETLTFATEYERVYNITAEVQELVDRSGVKDGVCVVTARDLPVALGLPSKYDQRGWDDAMDDMHRLIATRVDFEGELAMVIGRRCRNVRAQDFAQVVLGYTCLNDVTERDIQRADGQWTRGKGFDTFCPLGPWIVTDLDPSDLSVRTRLNGQLRHDSRTSRLIFSLGRVVEHITACMTLLPGDVIATGTPEGVGPMQRGDTVEVEIEGIGVLRNTVR